MCCAACWNGSASTRNRDLVVSRRDAETQRKSPLLSAPLRLCVRFVLLHLRLVVPIRPRLARERQRPRRDWHLAGLELLRQLDPRVAHLAAGRDLQVAVTR